jgi:phosphoenolpyruvate carboxykinase (GTP)
MDNAKKLLSEKLTPQHRDRLFALDNPGLHAFVADAIELACPQRVYVCTDSPADADYVRRRAVAAGEETPLALTGHTVHFDGYHDQGRDKSSTRYLLPPGASLGPTLNCTDKQTGLAEIKSLLKNAMVGREMLVCFFCLGPAGSDFATPCVQITDSYYVAHSESLLYRTGYEQFRKAGPAARFFRFLHSQGELKGSVSKNAEKRRVYIDLEENIVYSANTQYGGNTIGLKKLALRLAINKASREGWLAEHMFLLGVHGPAGRVTYFAGAFPSACGKTSTAMLPGHSIVGDDIAYLRKKTNQVRAVNVEKGIFGIIQDVNPTDDPIIYKVLTSPGEVIFSNVLVTDDRQPHWLGMGKPLPQRGCNHSGDWYAGKKDDDGNVITPSHKNARYTVSLYDLKNCDPLIDAPEGVPLRGIIYGGRDSDTWAPVEQAFNWTEGIVAKGAALESETTSATLGAEGVRSFNLMSNIDFIAIPLGRYIRNNLDFAAGLDNPPAIFSVNYFLRNSAGKYLNGMPDKRVWLAWAELRANNDIPAVETPTGFIPRCEDLAGLFRSELQKDYSSKQYVEQFTIRTPQLLAKLDRVENVYRTQVPDTPPVVFEVFAEHRARLQAAQKKHGDYISPFDLPPK